MANCFFFINFCWQFFTLGDYKNWATRLQLFEDVRRIYRNKYKPYINCILLVLFSKRRCYTFILFSISFQLLTLIMISHHSGSFFSSNLHMRFSSIYESETPCWSSTCTMHDYKRLWAMFVWARSFRAFRKYCCCLFASVKQITVLLYFYFLDSKC